MKRPERYTYPAVFAYVEGYEIAVTFPDLPGCATCGIDDANALLMGQEAMGLHIWGMESDNDVIPVPTRLCDVVVQSNERAVLISVFMPTIRLSQVNRSVNRTVTLPAWLNAAALERGVNFSQVLQNALMNEFNKKD